MKNFWQFKCFLLGLLPNGLKGRFFCIVVVGIIFAALTFGRFLSRFVSVRSLNFGSNNEDETNPVNETWKRIRMKLLSGRDDIPKVIILAHARGGSTLCSDIFNIESNNTIIWYEALHGFHSYYSGLPSRNIDTKLLYYQNLTRKTLGEHKRKSLTNYLAQLLECDVRSLPIDILTQFTRKFSIFDSYYECMKRRNSSRMHNKCQTFLYTGCFYPEYREVRVSPDSISSHARCENILRTFRRWNPQTTDEVTSVELLRRFLEEPYAREFKEVLQNSCNNLFSVVGLPPTKFEPAVIKGENTNYSAECRDVTSKFSAFVRHRECLETLAKNSFPHCQDILEPLCHQRKLVVAEVQRMFLTDLEPIILRMPDIHIVHYVRDPRAVSVSRAERQIHTFRHDINWTIVDEAILLCRTMRYNAEESLRLRGKFPGSMITVRYEDLVLDPTETVKKMYHYFGRPVPSKLPVWIESRLNATKDNGKYGVNRANSKRHLTKWRSLVKVSEIQLMNNRCRDVLIEYGYEV